MKFNINLSDEAKFLVVFIARLKTEQEGYQEASDLLNRLVADNPGFLGEQVTHHDDVSVSISYWRDRESIRRWRRQEDHARLQLEAKNRWYSECSVSVCAIERAYGFQAEAAAGD